MLGGISKWRLVSADWLAWEVTQVFTLKGCCDIDADQWAVVEVVTAYLLWNLEDLLKVFYLQIKLYFLEYYTNMTQIRAMSYLFIISLVSEIVIKTNSPQEQRLIPL